MTNPINPPAFPCAIQNREFPNSSQLERLPGMTLRDYFADGAMRELLTGKQPSRRCTSENMRGEIKYLDETEADWIAKESYFMADAMLKERQKEGK